MANMFVPFGCLCRGNILGCYVSLLICTFDVMEHRHRQRIMLQVFLSISCWLLLLLLLLLVFVRPNVIRSFVLLEIQSLAAMQKVVAIQAKQFHWSRAAHQLAMTHIEVFMFRSAILCRCFSSFASSFECYEKPDEPFLKGSTRKRKVNTKSTF